jgi:hypothetical protein
VLLVGWVGALVAAMVDRRRGKNGTRSLSTAGWLLLGATVALTLTYVITPYTALGLRDRPVVAGPNMRYLVPALMCAAAVGAWWVGRLGRARLVAEAVVGIAVLEGIHRGFDLSMRNWVAGAGLLALSGAAAFALIRLRGRFPQQRYAVVAGLLLALVVAGGLYQRQRAYYRDRYSHTQTVIKDLMATPNGGQRIGLAGYFDPHQLAPVWPAFGPRLQNRVEYIGKFRDGQLNEFPDAGSWQRRVEQRRYDLVAVGYGAYAPSCKQPGKESDDDAFARAAGYKLIASSSYLNVYRVR